ncbi:hypothetical protein DLJ49_12800 [Rhodovulum sp. 12E13]|uniref:hypothetical protein n=1 Tax=Rhodovulum sp. 12E13 TaxID=2203891 RepID=UPI000E166455|nr:hypothetical protein [Rhodovulum sp. 12E13]RDC71966.1 hypothetical protein DLJ49_12800 [Rhodovulum sp. 12E13]
MTGPLLFLLGLTLVLGLLVVRRAPRQLGPALADAARQGRKIGLRIPLGIFIATVLAQLIPREAIGPVIGPESGVRGILAATAFGAMMPGGPMVTFPIALLVWDMGAGKAQIVAFLVSWSIFAVHRILSFELPLMGGRFVALRLLSAWYLPPLAGLIALALIPLVPAF